MNSIIIKLLKIITEVIRVFSLKLSAIFEGLGSINNIIHTYILTMKKYYNSLL